MISRPPTVTPSSGSSSRRKPGRSSSGTLNVIPSSPPVRFDSCEARIAKNDATASVIIAKKIALTRSENKPIRKESTSDIESAATVPAAMAPQLGSIRVVAIAMP